MEIENVLKNFDIVPNSIENITNKVWKISAGGQTYALKRTKLSKEQLQMWVYVHNQNTQKNIQHILPLRLTKWKTYYFTEDDHIYYLSPWVEHQETSLVNVFEHLGKIHRQTGHQFRLEKERLKKQIHHYQEICHQHFDSIQSYVERFEKERYMSPIGLQVCTQFKEIQQMVGMTNAHLDLIEQQLSDEKDVFWKYCLCHGNMSMAHVVNDNGLFFLNWERAHLENPIYDLIKWFKNELTTYDKMSFPFTKGFSQYMNTYPLSKLERSYLIIYLLDLKTYLRNIELHFHQDSKQSMVYEIRNIEQQYRYLRFGLQFAHELKDYFMNEDQIHSK